MQDSSQLKQIVEIAEDCTGGLPGIRHKTWARCLEEDIESRGFGVYTAGEMAKDPEKRDEFRSKIVLGLP